ncbi:hypothetical protein BKA70DRAFT_48113 [Coprinopsis sp. MPI-PUGE-AT-0042]|nr:hypothetical protein BKA70DRAFT_48113 [Coprinopsis sp. MPI-PUGE-AT-0042]
MGNTGIATRIRADDEVFALVLDKGWEGGRCYWGCCAVFRERTSDLAAERWQPQSLILPYLLLQTQSTTMHQTTRPALEHLTIASNGCQGPPLASQATFLIRHFIGSTTPAYFPVVPRDILPPRRFQYRVMCSSSNILAMHVSKSLSHRFEADSCGSGCISFDSRPLS